MLLYNLGLGTFSHLRPDAVLITRSFAQPTWAPEGDVGTLVHHHRYELTAMLADRAESSGGIVARFDPVPLRQPCTVEAVWNDLRSSGRLVAEGRDCSGRLGLGLTLHRPSGAAPAMLGMVKVLVDGVISALHTHDGSRLDVVAERLSRRLGLPINQVGALLMDNPAAVLGRRRLLWPFRDFVQWNPAEDDIVSLSVTTTASSTWQLSGMLIDLGGVPDREHRPFIGSGPSTATIACRARPMQPLLARW